MKETVTIDLKDFVLEVSGYYIKGQRPIHDMDEGSRDEFEIISVMYKDDEILHILEFFDHKFFEHLTLGERIKHFDIISFLETEALKALR